MQLTGKQIKERGVLRGILGENIQQQGVDVRVSEIFLVEGGGLIPERGKTQLPTSNKVSIMGDGRYHLSPGYYEVKFVEGCDVPPNLTLHLKTRSSLVRCGSIIHSGQFDAGFNTEAMGAFLQVNIPITIEPGARLAQVLCFETASVEEEALYSGQYQHDRQRSGND